MNKWHKQYKLHKYLYHQYFLAIILALLFLLSGCTTLRTNFTSHYSVNADHWQLQGKIGIISPEKNGSANLFWAQYQDNYQIKLFGPLGIGAIALNGNPHQVTYTSEDGLIRSSDSPEALLNQHLGWTVPLSALTYWVRAESAPYLPAQKIFNPAHQLIWLTQKGWRIHYLAYQKNMPVLPIIIVLQKEAVKIRVVINHWA